MDIYRLTVEYLLNIPIFDAWQEMKTILQRAASRRPRDWQLPIAACQAVGKPPARAIPASAALACSLIGILLVDDILDDDPRGEYRQLGSGRAANLALAFQAAAMEALRRADAPVPVRLEALCSLSRMMLATARGQDLDVQNPPDEAAYWRVVEEKSAPFFGCAFHLGALLGGARGEVVRNIERVGRVYGEMIQIHDDLNDAMAVPANPDWLQQRRPLPVLFALTVEHVDRERFTELYEDVSTGEALQEAQEILIRCGAVSYCVDQLLRRHRMAQGMIRDTPLADPGPIDARFEGVIAPVWKLFETLGISRDAAPTGTGLPDRA